MKQPKYKLIQSLSRAFAIIDCFDRNNQALTLNEIAEKTDLNINTTRGLVQTLLYYNYLAYDKESNLYRLGIIFLEKAELAEYDQTQRLIDLIESDMQNIANEYNTSIRILTIEGTNIANSEIINPRQSRYLLQIRDNVDFPLYASATGKLLLSEANDRFRKNIIDNLDWRKYGKNTITNEEDLLTALKETKDQGYATEFDELGDGFSSLAFPIFIDDELRFSLSATATTEIVQRNLDQLVEDMKSTAEKATEYLK